MVFYYQNNGRQDYQAMALCSGVVFNGGFDIGGRLWLLEQWSSETLYNSSIERKLTWDKLTPYERKRLLEERNQARIDFEEYYDDPFYFDNPFEYSEFGPGASYWFNRRDR